MSKFSNRFNGKGSFSAHMFSCGYDIKTYLSSGAYDPPKEICDVCGKSFSETEMVQNDYINLCRGCTVQEVMDPDVLNKWEQEDLEYQMANMAGEEC